jgi:hypothetical protein
MPIDCKYHEDHENRIKAAEDNIKSLYLRTDAANERQIRTETKLDQVIDTLKDLCIKVESLSAKAGKRWDGLVSVATAAVAGGIISIVLSKLF